jgi:hypothetical protein
MKMMIKAIKANPIEINYKKFRGLELLWVSFATF